LPKIKKARVFRPGPLGCEGEPQIQTYSVVGEGVRLGESRRRVLSLLLTKSFGNVLSCQKPAHHNRAGRAWVPTSCRRRLLICSISIASAVPCFGLCDCDAGKFFVQAINLLYTCQLPPNPAALLRASSFAKIEMFRYKSELAITFCSTRAVLRNDSLRRRRATANATAQNYRTTASLRVALKLPAFK